MKHTLSSAGTLVSSEAAAILIEIESDFVFDLIFVVKKNKFSEQKNLEIFLSFWRS